MDKSKRITDLMLRNFKAAKPTKLSLGEGLYAYCKPNGTKTFRRKYYFANREKTLTLGNYPLLSIAEARNLNFEANKLLTQGIDPQVQKQAAKAAKATGPTFKQISMNWFDVYKGEVKEKTAEGVWRRLELNVFPVLGNKEITKIQRSEIRDVVTKVQDREALDLSLRLVSMISRVFDFAIDAGIASENPAMRINKTLRKPKTRHHACFPIEEIPVFLQKLSSNQANLCLETRIAMRLLVLTFLRTGEVTDAKWSEFNFEKAEWVIPAARMKMKRSHIVPLSKQSLALLEELKEFTQPGTDDFLFTNARDPRRPISKGAFLQALRRMGYKAGEMTGHGFRSLAFSAATERLGFRPEVPDRQLAHKASGTSLGSAYDRGEFINDRKALMQDWADYLTFCEKVGRLPQGDEWRFLRT